MTATRPESGPPPARSEKSIRAATDALGAAARDADPSIRELVVGLLGCVGPECTIADAAPPIIAALQDPSPPVRTAAMKAVGTLGAKADPAIPILLKTAATEEGKVRDAAARSLETVKPSPAVVPLLVESLKDPDRGTRIRAATVLGHIGPGAAGASPDLIARLQEEFKSPLPQPVGRGPAASYDPGSAAARALAEIAPEAGASPETLAALTDALQTPEDPRHQAIAVAFGVLGPKAVSAVPTLIADLKRAKPKDGYAGQVGARALAADRPRDARGGRGRRGPDRGPEVRVRPHPPRRRLGPGRARSQGRARPRRPPRPGRRTGPPASAPRPRSRSSRSTRRSHHRPERRTAPGLAFERSGSPRRSTRHEGAPFLDGLPLWYHYDTGRDQ